VDTACRRGFRLGDLKVGSGEGTGLHFYSYRQYRPALTLDQGVLEISRFSCMSFLSVRGFSDYAGPTVHSRLARLPCCLPPIRNEVGILIYGLFAAQ
jgi:hypothetical protein